MPNKSGYGLKKQLSSPNLKRRTKCMLQKARIRLTHGNEGWPLSKEDRNLLQSVGRVLRMIYGPINNNGIWRT